MKNSLNLCLIILGLIALGCNCGDRLKELSNRDSQPTNRSTPTTTSSPDSPPATKGDYDVTMDKYDRVRVGMKRSEVENIFGGKGTEYYSGKGGGVSFVSVKWVGEKFKTVLVSFRNDKVTSKSQVGLN